MSTNLDCRFVEKEPRKWYFELERYHERDEYDVSGPYPTFGAAERALRNSGEPNPGGCSIRPLPGCKHDLLAGEPRTEWDTKERVDNCERCGHPVTLADRAAWDAIVVPAVRKRFPGRQSPLLKAALDAAFAARETASSAPRVVGNVLARATREAVRDALAAAGFADCDGYKRAGYSIPDHGGGDDGSVVLNHVIPGGMRSTPGHEAEAQKYLQALAAAGIPARAAGFPGTLVAGPVRRAPGKARKTREATSPSGSPLAFAEA